MQFHRRLSQLVTITNTFILRSREIAFFDPFLREMRLMCPWRGATNDPAKGLDELDAE